MKYVGIGVAVFVMLLAAYVTIESANCTQQDMNLALVEFEYQCVERTR